MGQSLVFTLAGLRRAAFLAICLALTSGAILVAQEEAPAEPAESAADDPAATSAEIPSAAVPSTDGLPRYPLPFHRGNATDPAFQGFYLRLGTFIPIVLLFLGWVATSRWVDEDSQALKLRATYWNTIVFLGGMAGFLLVFLLPNLVLGLPMLAIAAGAPLAWYITERNNRVPEGRRVLTPKHLTSVANRLLARFGISLGSKNEPVIGGGPPIRFVGKSVVGKGEGPDRSRQVENSRGYAAARELIYDSIVRRATDVHLEPYEDELAVRIRIDGVMLSGDPFDVDTGQAVINVFKVLSAMDITERRRPQDGSFRAETMGRQVDFRVATQGTRYGEKMSLRILDQGSVSPELPKLGMPKRTSDRVTRLIQEPHGLILCCGPTGAGKSTTLYAALTAIDRYQRNVITVEDPIEYRIPHVNQIEINQKAGQTFAGSLRSILRQDPDVVMIGEIRDAETATIACQAANTGHMVFSTVHANDTITALYRLLELGIEAYVVADSVTGLIGQRLVRRLCTQCREAYRPNAELVRKAGLPPEKCETFYRVPKTEQNDCPACGGTGFQGRIGVYELLVMSDRIREMLRSKAPVAALKAEARKDGMLTMQEEGLRLVARGITSIDELLRVVK